MGRFSEMAIVDYHLQPRKTNFRIPFPFLANKSKFAVSVSCLQKTKRSCRFPLVPFPFVEACKHGHGDIKWKKENRSPGNFP
jgi:hypothetical protein